MPILFLSLLSTPLAHDSFSLNLATSLLLTSSILSILLSFSSLASAVLVFWSSTKTLPLLMLGVPHPCFYSSVCPLKAFSHFREQSMNRLTHILKEGANIKGYQRADALRRASDDLENAISSNMQQQPDIRWFEVTKSIFLKTSTE